MNMEGKDRIMDIEGKHVINPYDTFVSTKISILSPSSDYMLNSTNTHNNDTPPALEAGTRMGGLLTPAGTAPAKGVSPVTIGNNTNHANLSKEGLTESELKEIKRAQNRAAQRAFRERKEAKLKELEQELQLSEFHRKHLDEELKRLRKENLRIYAENKILLEQGVFGNDEKESETFTFPHETEYERLHSLEEIKRYRRDLIKTRGHYYDASGKEILTVPATWDYLQILSENVDFNVASVLDSLKGKEICHGFGAAYPRALVDQLVQQQYLRDAGRI